MMFLLAASLLALGQAPPPPAEAPTMLPAPPLPPEHPSPAPAAGGSSATQEWYGWQTLAFDVPALALCWSGFALSRQGNVVGGRLANGGIVLYTLGPPLVHLLRGRGLIGLADLGLRVGGALLGGMAGGSPAPCSTSSSSPSA